MGKMPADREKRWDSIFRRYGIPDDDPETEPKPPEKFGGVKKQVKKLLLPEDSVLSHPERARK